MNNSGKKPLALYVHIPFCIRKCLYCDFLSAPGNEEKKKAYVEKLLKEMEYWRHRIEKDYQLKTVFLGGGTPTCLSAEKLCLLGEKILTFPGSGPLEYTIEANPGTISPEIIRAMKKMKADRVSMGLQSADNGELKNLGRIHTWEDFLNSFRLLRAHGFSNINIDLMADIPGQTVESYLRTLEQVCALQPEHISSYSLIIEEGTPFYEMQQKGLLKIPDEETDRRMYELTEQVLKKHGYFRYEISNYAKKGMECRHNLTYWEMGEYLGLGLGASSYFQGERFQNETDLDVYLNAPVEECIAVERKICSEKEKMEEFVFLGLRKTEGISALEFSKCFRKSFYEVYGDVLPPLLENGLLANSENRDRIYLTKKGIDLSNMVLSEFLLDMVP